MTTNANTRRRGEAPLGIPARPAPRALPVAGEMGGIGKATTAGRVHALAVGGGSATAAITRNTGHRLARGWRSAR